MIKGGCVLLAAFAVAVELNHRPDLEFGLYPLESLALELLGLSLRTPIIAGGSGPSAHLPPLGLSAPVFLPASPAHQSPPSEMLS